MKIKTFQALTMGEALRLIKQELGPDAVILSSKQVRKGGGMFGLFGRPMVEVAAAVDAGSPGPARSHGRRPAGQSGAWTSGSDSKAAVPARPASGAGRGAQGRGDWGRGWVVDVDRARQTRFEDALRNQIVKPPGQKDVLLLNKDQRAASFTEHRGEAAWEGIKEELRSLRRFMESSLHMGRGERQDWLERLPARLAARYQGLLGIGLESETAQRLVTKVLERAQPAELESEASVRQALARLMVREIKVGGPLLGMGEWKKTVIVTGPTGVGKTTTIAKLAAHYKLREKRQVALITLDTYRVAAVEQLRMYANVIGVSMDVALTKREALEHIRRRSKAELILIDTAGRSPKDEAGMEELRQLFDLDHPLETHLVLSATTRERDLAEGLTQYAGIPVNRLLFTKLDETTGFGGMFDLMLRSGLPLSYFSTGQSVPDDLEVARPERLAELLLGGELRSVASSVKREA
jgi:flagellar biosynthesis protein FlhF